ncbi:hypothetical protein [Klebsiella pneumoniae]|uniref:hypothetical protein n=2 Tax=Klebsiella pneumoniae TaxID=573 RepID=UPI00226F33FA|nr:hypothetical protein [Klebsiella pneumoniae]MCX9899644.1 hypothetical protein [Klebsiella pneumoniae]
MGEISVKTGNNARNGGKNSLNRLIRCVCGKKIGPDPRNFNQRVSLGRNDLLIRTFLSFSTHSISEEMHIPRDDVLDRFDEVELELLSQFYKFIRDRRDKFWVHWNMRNLTYGFEHLEHRYRVLGGKDACVIAVERRLNLNDLLADRYGADYAKHPKMLSLMDQNGGRHRDFLGGKEEVEAFENKEFLRMHTSTLSKVGFFSSTMGKFVSGKLKTASKGYGVRLDKLFESRTVKSLGLISIIFGLPVAIWQLYLWTVG